MTTVATLSKAPFGSNAVRFPDKLSSSTSEELGPGRYELDTGAFSAKAVARRASGPGWARAYETSHSTPLPYLLNKEEWEKVRDLPRKLGPGAYNVKDTMEASYSRGILSMREQRFKDEKSRHLANGFHSPGGAESDTYTHCHSPICLKMMTLRHLANGIVEYVDHSTKSYGEVSEFTVKTKKVVRLRGKNMATPGPGSYGEGGIPSAAIEKQMRTSFGSVSLLSSGNAEIRPSTVVGTRLAPGTYNIPSTIDEFINKKTGNQGPYKVFTLDRSKAIITGHHGIAVSHSIGPGEYNLKSAVNESLKTSSGKFNIAAQYPEYPSDRIIISNLSLNPRDPREPGPGHYDLSCRPTSQSSASPPFMSSCQRTDKRTTQMFTGNYNSVGPGRYDVLKRSNAQNINGNQSVFKSKTNRPSGIQLRVLNERMAAKNLPFPRDHMLLVRS